ncbi:hypothetical protein IFM89_007444 [Coptis chinensis]|uniref:Uncharacterized protein n=1 Tax=Coptis chinensis TaxID=261450 RepID=A0A835I8S8_9MAGN|nr:hypothetical protein IFM89_007444 [Coptis chinensis]
MLGGKQLRKCVWERTSFSRDMNEVWNIDGWMSLLIEVTSEQRSAATSGTKFEDIDLSGGEYADYCEKGQIPVMISNLQAKFDVVK